MTSGFTFDEIFFKNSDVDIIYTCSTCLKKIGLEKRFIVKPMEIICPYCKTTLTLADKDPKGDKNETQ
jgi:DNA-directed RNA polymerase subunit RPC12/RpoP